MSRLGKIPVTVPKGVSVTLKDKRMTVQGPKGTLVLDLIPEIDVKVEPDALHVSLAGDNPAKNPKFGLYRQLINNVIVGVSQGFEKRLQMVGVGYRATVQGKVLDVLVGYSHPTPMEIPTGIEVKVEKNTLIIISGIDNRSVGQFAANVRSLRPPEPYKGKGIRYEGEHVRRKAGKTGKK